MAVYNGARYLGEAIDSVLRQTMRDFELLIVNDGSTDETREIVRSYHDSRIRLVDNERNEGLSRSLNKGLRLASADLVARLDADDICERKRLKQQVMFMDAHPAVALLGSSYTEIDEHGKAIRNVDLPTVPEDIRWYLLFLTPFCHSAVMLRRSSLIGGVGLYDESLHYAMDYELWRRIAQRLPVASLADMLVRYRVHSESMSEGHMPLANEGYQLRIRAVCKLLEWDGLEWEEQMTRFNKMYSLLLREQSGMEPKDAEAIAAELMRLHDVCRESNALGDGDWISHAIQLRCLLDSRLTMNVRIGKSV